MNKSGFVLIQPTVLYNILQQKKFYPCLSDPNYLILLGKYSFLVKLLSSLQRLSGRADIPTDRLSLSHSLNIYKQVGGGGGYGDISKAINNFWRRSNFFILLIFLINILLLITVEF